MPALVAGILLASKIKHVDGRERAGHCAVCVALTEYGGNLNVAAPLHDLDRNLVSVAADFQVDARLVERQIAHYELVQKRGQAWIAKTDFVAGGIEVQSERSFDQRKRRGARPGLWRACDRIERRPATAAALKAAEQFRQAPHLQIARGIEQAFE